MSSSAKCDKAQREFARSRGWTIARSFAHSWRRPGDHRSGFNRNGIPAALLIHARRPFDLATFIDYAHQHFYLPPTAPPEPSWYGADHTLILLTYPTAAR